VFKSDEKLNRFSAGSGFLENKTLIIIALLVLLIVAFSAAVYFIYREEPIPLDELPGVSGTIKEIKENEIVIIDQYWAHEGEKYIEIKEEKIILIDDKTVIKKTFRDYSEDYDPEIEGVRMAYKDIQLTDLKAGDYIEALYRKSKKDKIFRAFKIIVFY